MAGTPTTDTLLKSAAEKVRLTNRMIGNNGMLRASFRQYKATLNHQVPWYIRPTWLLQDVVAPASLFVVIAYWSGVFLLNEAGPTTVRARCCCQQRGHLQAPS
jgi:hypothetical protein